MITWQAASILKEIVNITLLTSFAITTFQTVGYDFGTKVALEIRDYEGSVGAFGALLL